MLRLTIEDENRRIALHSHGGILLLPEMRIALAKTYIQRHWAQMQEGTRRSSPMDRGLQCTRVKGDDVDVRAPRTKKRASDTGAAPANKVKNGTH